MYVCTTNIKNQEPEDDDDDDDIDDRKIDNNMYVCQMLKTRTRWWW